MKANVTRRARPCPEHTHEFELRNPGFFFELAMKCNLQRFSPLERPAGQTPLTGIGAANQQDSSIIGTRHRSNSNDRTPEQMARDFVNDSVRRFWQPRQDHGRTLPGATDVVNRGP